MIKFEDLKQLHLEITNRCQASCPMCSRNINSGIENPLIKNADWTLEDYKTIINPEVLHTVRMIYFCGTFGDPLLNNELIEMCKYSREVNPDIEFHIHTNGSLRSKEWWKEFAQALPKNHKVIFGIDGLEDTHHLYRVGTNYERIIENATAFIEAEGIAEWHYIIFKHNQHQVDKAKIKADEIGFNKFEKKQSTRFVLEPRVPVVNKDNEVQHYIEPSDLIPIKFIDEEVVTNWRQIIDTVDIDCKVVHTKEVYIDANKDLFPCCWHATIPYTHIPEDASYEVRTEMFNQYQEMQQRFGSTNTLTRSVKEIVNSHEYQTCWNEYWNENKLIVCARSCGKGIDFAQPEDQFLDNKDNYKGYNE